MKMPLSELPSVKYCSTRSYWTMGESSANLLLDFHLLKILCIVASPEHSAYLML